MAESTGRGPYRTWEATLKKQDEQEDADAARKRREAAAAAACGGCRNLDRTEERALFAQPVGRLSKAPSSRYEGASACFRRADWSAPSNGTRKALVAYDRAFPEDGENAGYWTRDAARRSAWSARVYLEAKLFRAALRACREVPENDEGAFWRRGPAASSICSTRRGRL